MPRYWKTRRK